MELCSRCDKLATDEIWCAKHYAQWLSEWACSCGETNGGSINRNQTKCAFCQEKRES